MRQRRARLAPWAIVTATAVAAATAFAAPAPPRDGELVERSEVRFTEKEIAALAGRLADVRELLAEVTIERITYGSDGLRVKGYLVAPRGGERLPCVIFNRGGNREFGALTDESAALWLGSIARHGYVVVASQYRGNAGGEGREEFGGADVADVLHLIPLLESLPRADATRIGMYGWSRGGLMTYLALARTERIRAAIVGGGMSDASDMVALRPEMETEVLAELVPNWERERDAALAARSPVRWVERLHKGTPILLLHGGADWRVHPSEALRMAEALLAARHPFRLILFEGGDHGLSEHRAERNRVALEWLDAYVRDGRRWPSLEPHGE